MSGDQHNQAGPPDLDAIEAWFEGKTQHSSLDDLSVIPEWHAVRDLVAEVRRLRDAGRAVIVADDDSVSYEPCAECLRSGVALLDGASYDASDAAVEALRAVLDGP